MAEQFIESHGLKFTGEDAWNAGMEHWLENSRVRTEYIRRFGFAILSSKTLAALRPYAPFVEVGCGTGYWAYEMRRSGIDVIATEPYPERNGRYLNTDWKLYTQIEKMTGPRAARKYKDRTLLTVWPDYKNRWPAITLSVYQGPRVVYVGEGNGGCTGTDEFHELLERKFDLEKTISIPQFYGIYDRMMIYRRKETINGR
jgi:hypothetical protein